MEIVTVGCMGMNNLCDPDMRIWLIATTLPIEFIITILISVAVTVTASAYFFVKKREARGYTDPKKLLLTGTLCSCALYLLSREV